MNNNKETFLTNNSRRILFILFAFIMLYLVSYMIDPYANFWKEYLQRPPKVIGTELFFTLIFCILISESSIFINNKFNKYVPWIEKPMLRLGLQTLALMTSTLLIISTEFLLNYLFFEEANSDFGQEEITSVWQWVVVSIFITLTISGINTVNYLINNWKKTSVEAAEYKQAAAEAELHALKLQVDPHFVFNNLSVLSEIILEDQQLGYQYAENFSKVYRYLLLNAKKDLITLEDELKFVRAYIFLITNRVGTGVSFHIDIDDSYLGSQLPPLTMQILIENALKHNKTIKTSPLEITINVDGEENLVVSNTLAPLEKKALSSGFGLNNIINRYKLLSEKSPKIEVGATSFTVTIPLLKVAKN